MDIVACGSCGRLFSRTIVEKLDRNGVPAAYRRDKGGIANQMSISCSHPGCGGVLLRKVEGVLVTEVMDVGANVDVEAGSVESARNIASGRAGASVLDD